MASPKNITRYTYPMNSFQGWRLALRRKGIAFIRYFSDREYGGEQKSLQAATRMREAILACLGEGKESPETVFERFKRENDLSRFPRGLKQRHRPHPEGC